MAAPPELPSTQKALYFTSTHTISLNNPGYNLSGDKPTVIRAPVILLSGEFRAAGQSVWLIADRIVAEPNATIDTTGKEGIPNYPATQKAPAGAADGAPGTDADSSGLPHAGAGQNGGDILIACRELQGNLTLKANGGRGGNGLNGGDGARGRNGDNGQEKADNKVNASGKPGSKGGKGIPLHTSHASPNCRA